MDDGLKVLVLIGGAGGIAGLIYGVMRLLGGPPRKPEGFVEPQENPYTDD